MQLSTQARLYISFLAAFTALAEIALLLFATPFPKDGDRALAIAFAVLLSLFGSFRVRIGREAVVSLDFSVLFASAILLAPGIAVLVAIVGVLASSIARRMPHEKTIFNTATLALVTGVASEVLHSNGPMNVISALQTDVGILVIVSAGALAFMLNTALFVQMLSLAAVQNWRETLRDLGWPTLLSSCVDVGLGLATAIIGQIAPWAVLVILVPVLGVYLLLQRQSELASDLKQAVGDAQSMMHRAYHDPLTGLGNRALLTDKLDVSLAHSERTGEGVALLFIDLNGFKQVNDRMGHAAGDELLCQVGRRLRNTVRAHDTVVRQGGDEFVVLLDGVDEEEANGISRRLVDLLRQPFQLDSGEAKVSASVGVAHTCKGTVAKEELLAQADQAMYASKGAYPHSPLTSANADQS